MAPSMALIIGLLALLVVGVVFVIPAGYGLPGPIFGLLALLAITPGLAIIWMLYRRAIRRGDISPPNQDAKNIVAGGARPQERVLEQDDNARFVGAESETEESRSQPQR